MPPKQAINAGLDLCHAVRLVGQPPHADKCSENSEDQPCCFVAAMLYQIDSSHSLLNGQDVVSVASHGSQRVAGR
jgi:hypothetical protein